jgi:hypothetical protein
MTVREEFYVMQHYLISCRSLTYAQRAVRVLERAGITASAVRTPQSVAAGGCGYCVSVSYKYGVRAAALLREEKLLHGRIYLRDEAGELREAEL